MQDRMDGFESLPQVPLGRSGKQCSRLALGGFHQLEISSEHVADVVEAYFAEGGNYIETARDYGQGASEEKIGKAIEGRRDQVVLCSKTSAATADQLRADLELTLKALRTDRLDFYFFHCVDHDKLQAITASGGALEAMSQARDQHVIGGIGFSSHQPEVYLEALGRLDLSLILVWLNYLDNLNFPIIPDRVLPEAHQRGVGVTAMKPLADGLLYRSIRSAVAYCLGAGAEVMVCGTNSVQHVHELAEAVRNGPADADQRHRMLAEAPELGTYVCRRCGRCGPDLMEVFRLEGMYDRQMMDFVPRNPADHALRRLLSGWFHLEKAACQEYVGKGFDAGRLADQAKRATCPYGIDLPRKLRIAAAKLSGQSPQTV